MHYDALGKKKAGWNDILMHICLCFLSPKTSSSQDFPSHIGYSQIFCAYLKSQGKLVAKKIRFPCDKAVEYVPIVTAAIRGQDFQIS